MADWSDQTRQDTILVYDVDPHSLEVRQQLSGVELSGSSITWGYYTDTRVSGTLKVKDTNHIDHSLIRIVHSIPDWSYSNELATMVVTNDDADRDSGAWITSYELHSALSMLENDLLACCYSIGAGAKAKAIISSLIGNADRPYLFGGDFLDHIYTESKVYDFGNSVLKTLFDICDTADDHLNVDGHGRILIDGYIPPHYIDPSWELDLSNSDTNVLDKISRSSDRLSTPTRVIVHYKGTKQVQSGNSISSEEVEVSAYVDATTGETRASRGYTVAKLYEAQDLSPQDVNAARKLAETYLPSAHDTTLTWQLSCLYMPMKIGECVTLIFHDGPDSGSHHCLVQTITLSLDTMVMKLTLKEV
jgi:hypothetical protein